MTATVEVPERELREFIEAAEEVRREAGSRLHETTDREFDLALESLKFALSVGALR